MLSKVSMGMDLLVIAALSLLLVLLVSMVSLPPLQIALGVLAVAFFPGYVFTAALFPRDGLLDGPERAALSIGLSIALVPLLGLALNFTPWGIRPASIVSALTLWTLLVAGVAWLRRRSVDRGDRLDFGWWHTSEWRRRLHSPEYVWAIGLALLVVALLGIASWRAVRPSNVETFTEFYILGPDRFLRDYPTLLWVGRSQPYTLGVVNRERRDVTYTIRAFLGGDQVGSVGPLLLAHDEKWEREMLIIPARTAEREKLEFKLFLGTEPEPAMILHLWAQVRESG